MDCINLILLKKKTYKGLNYSSLTYRGRVRFIKLYIRNN